MASVTFDHVTKQFGDVVALDDLDLEVADREFLVLLGPSGCGKSTALRLVAGLEHATSGSVHIDDRVVDHVDPKDRDVAMVFQSYALYPHRTVRQNIEFPLEARKVPASERDGLVADVAAQLGLEGLLDRKPRALSGGQRQRVALARAIVRRPVVFLMDEPLSNLDANTRSSTRAELVELHGRLGTTFVYVTHDQVEAMTMGTRIAVLEGGRLQQVGPPQAVYDEPANVFVAQFIGSPPMNVLPAGAGGPLGVPGTDLRVGVRPEHFRLDAEGIPAHVRLIESLGHERHLLCMLTGGEQVVVRTPASTSTALPREGDTVHLGAEARHLHLFDAATGERK
jgi:multiple sugar transport system ATP-binding protein